MATFETNELTFEVPDDYIDRSINVFLPSSARDGNSSIIVTREARTEGTLAQQVNGLLDAAAGKVRGLKLIGQRDREVGTVPGREVRLHGQTGRVPTYQRQIYVTHYGRLLAITVSTPRAQSASCDAVMERVLGSLHLAKI